MSTFRITMIALALCSLAGCGKVDDSTSDVSAGAGGGAAGQGTMGGDSGSAGSSGHAGSGGEAGGGAGGQGAAGAAISCQGHSNHLFAVPQQGACIDTMSPAVVVGCFDVPPNQGPNLGLFCVRRVSDGATFWAFGDWAHPLLAEGYAACTDAVPAPCFESSCSVPLDTIHIQSGCTLKDTIGTMGCGNPDSPYDDGCCTRRPCSGPQDCASNEGCKTVHAVFTYITSGILEGACVSTSAFGGLPQLVCVPGM